MTCSDVGEITSHAGSPLSEQTMLVKFCELKNFPKQPPSVLQNFIELTCDKPLRSGETRPSLTGVETERVCSSAARNTVKWMMTVPTDGLAGIKVMNLFS